MYFRSFVSMSFSGTTMWIPLVGDSVYIGEEKFSSEWTRVWLHRRKFIIFKCDKMYKLFLILLFITFVASQGTIFSKEKPGSCPPPLPLQICSQACFFDIHCQGIGKCCPTSCGGYICSRPVTMRPPPQPGNYFKYC